MKVLRGFFVGLFLFGCYLHVVAIEFSANSKEEQGVVYKQTPQGELKLDIYMCEKSRTAKAPLLVYIHGGSWQRGNRREIKGGFPKELSDSLLCRGYNVASIEYRLISDKNGVRFVDQLADCRDAIRWLKSKSDVYRIDTAHIAVGGSSAGGHLALMTAYAPDTMALGDAHLQKLSYRVNCCIDFFGPTHIGKILRPTLGSLAVGTAKLIMPRMVRERKILLNGFTGFSASHRWKRHKACRRFSPVEYVKRAVPTVIFHGDKDRLVPLGQSKLLVKKMQQAGKPIELYCQEGEDHAFPTITKEAQTKMVNQAVDFLERYNL